MSRKAAGVLASPFPIASSIAIASLINLSANPNSRKLYLRSKSAPRPAEHGRRPNLSNHFQDPHFEVAAGFPPPLSPISQRLRGPPRSVLFGIEPSRGPQRP